MVKLCVGGKRERFAYIKYRLGTECRMSAKGYV